MRNVLVTGANGFVGRHLLRLLRASEDMIYGSTLRESGKPMVEQDGAVALACDITDGRAVREAVQRVKPQALYHLAGEASPGKSWVNSVATYETNVIGTSLLMEALQEFSPNCKVVLVTSAAVYGKVSAAECPIQESQPLRPVDPYGISKAAQDSIGLQFAASSDLEVVIARPFNHIGPGQTTGFVVGKIATRIAEIEMGVCDPVMELGALSAKRDFTDVRDVASAYMLLMDRGRNGVHYNVASGKVESIEKVLQLALEQTDRDIEIRASEQLRRPIDLPVLVGDPSRLQNEIGWRPVISLEQSISDAVTHAREEILKR